MGGTAQCWAAAAQAEIRAAVEKLQACFALLHDAYVGEGYMKPDPSGMRVTPYHALPTTTTLAALWDGEVVGTISLVREGVFGFPLQAAFDLTEVRSREGQIAEVSALAVHRSFRKTGGRILFPLMKFMYEYAGGIFDTRHLLIAVHPTRIELYESLLLFERLSASEVDEYDFANGAPAIGASLDLQLAPRRFGQVYNGKSDRKNLLRYFTEVRMKNIRMPVRHYHVTTDPVMTPELLDLFFNRHTQVFDSLSDRQKLLLHEVYTEPDFTPVLPLIPPPMAQPSPGAERAGQPGSAWGGGSGLAAGAAPGSMTGAGTGAGPAAALRRHPRYSLKCPARLSVAVGSRAADTMAFVIDASQQGFQARTQAELQPGSVWRVRVELGLGVHSEILAAVRRRVQSSAGLYYGFEIQEFDDVWRACVESLARSITGADLALNVRAA